jgi:DNA-binding NarL/FixJ family response regulator
MLEAGARGFVEKTTELKELKTGVAALAAAAPSAGVLRSAVAHPKSGGSHDFQTARERELMQLVAEGNTTKAIAA